MTSRRGFFAAIAGAFAVATMPTTTLVAAEPHEIDPEPFLLVAPEPFLVTFDDLARCYLDPAAIAIANALDPLDDELVDFGYVLRPMYVRFDPARLPA